MFQLAWPASWVGIDISVKELVPGGSGSSFVGGEMVKRHVRTHSDNMAVVSVIK